MFGGASAGVTQCVVPVIHRVTTTIFISFFFVHFSLFLPVNNHCLDCNNARRTFHLSLEIRAQRVSTIPWNDQQYISFTINLTVIVTVDRYNIPSILLVGKL